MYHSYGSYPLDPRYLESTVKHPDSLMVWGCFSGLGLRKLVVLPKNLKVNANVYLELLADHLPESFDMVHQLTWPNLLHSGSEIVRYLLLMTDQVTALI